MPMHQWTVIARATDTAHHYTGPSGRRAHTRAYVRSTCNHAQERSTHVQGLRMVFSTMSPLLGNLPQQSYDVAPLRHAQRLTSAQLILCPGRKKEAAFKSSSFSVLHSRRGRVSTSICYNQGLLRALPSNCQSLLTPLAVERSETCFVRFESNWS